MEVAKNRCSNAARKVGILITAAASLGMDLGGYGFADENETSGNVYIWLEDYPWVLFIDLGSDAVNVGWSCPNCGEEFEEELNTTNMQDLYDLVEEWESGEGCTACQPTEKEGVTNV